MRSKYSIFSDCLEYRPDTGMLLWKETRNWKSPVGSEAGSIKTCGRYRSFVLNGKRFYTHRVAWELFTGKPVPEGMCIDHIDGNGLNNRIDNLRVNTLSGNQRNRRLSKNAKHGINGVFSHKGGFSVYCAAQYAGWSKDFFEACCIRMSAELKHNYYGVFTA
jgi:hypothetical protein